MSFFKWHDDDNNDITSDEFLEFKKWLNELNKWKL